MAKVFGLTPVKVYGLTPVKVYGISFPPPTDYVKALLHMNGTDASTTFTDEDGKTWTARGNAQIDTAQKKFGTASGLFDATGDWIDTPDHADFSVGSGDFTIDFWIMLTLWGYKMICGQCDSSASNASMSFVCAINASQKPEMYICSGSSAYTATSTGTITPDSTWHHLAFVRDGNTVRIFIDGSAAGTKDVTGVTVNDSSKNMSIGRAGEYATYCLGGWIDEFRFSKGIARWTANFTPPSAEYTLD